MQTTPNYNYNLPEYSDSADIAVLNANFSSIDANEYRIEGKLNALGNDIALPYDNTATYSVGDYTIYNNALYRCITAIATAEDFDSTKWTAITIGGELKSHDTRISTLEAGVDLEKSATNSFDDGIDSYFKKVVSSIVPVQAGSGTPSPTNVRAISGFTSCSVLDISDLTNVGYFMGLLKGTYGYVDLGTLAWNYTSSSQQFYVSYETIPNSPKTPSTNVKANAICSKYEVVARDNATNLTFCIATNGNFVIYDDNYTNATTFKNAMSGVYLIYELATPITPTITDAQLQTLLAKFGYTGSTATISFGSAGTVYGGYVDLISGKLVVDRGYKEFDGSSDENISQYGGNCFTIAISDYTSPGSTTLDDIICDKLETISKNYQGSAYKISGSDTGAHAIMISLEVTTLADAKTWLSNNPIQVVYPLTTPQEYQLTPAQLRSLVGANRLTSSTGEVTEVEYIKNETIAWLLDLIRVQEV